MKTAPIKDTEPISENAPIENTAPTGEYAPRGENAPIDPVFRNESFGDHEQVVFCSDKTSGLRAIIAIHDTRLGPGLGGTRMWAYDSEGAALRDALRLSHAMTLKNALAGLALGGAKAVIMASPQAMRGAAREALLKAYARHIERLGGWFITGEDVGTSVADMDVIARVTEHVRGTSKGRVGDPSPFTAYGVMRGIEAALRHKLGAQSLEGATIALQGLGHVGMALAGLLHERGARLVVADIRTDRIAEARERFKAQVVAPESAHAVEADLFAPCALGGVLNARSIAEIRAPIVAGAANNQLETPQDGHRLAARGILYAPDYAINAGGVIAIAHDTPDFDEKRLYGRLDGIADTLGEIFARAEESGRPTSEIADTMATERLAARGKGQRGAMAPSEREEEKQRQVPPELWQSREYDTAAH